MKNDVPKYKTLTYVIFVSHLCALKRFYFWLDPDNFLSFLTLFKCLVALAMATFLDTRTSLASSTNIRIIKM